MPGDPSTREPRLEGIEKQRGLPRGALATVDLRARLLEASDDRDKALDLLREYAKRTGAQVRGTESHGPDLTAV